MKKTIRKLGRRLRRLGVTSIGRVGKTWDLGGCFFGAISSVGPNESYSVEDVVFPGSTYA